MKKSRKAIKKPPISREQKIQSIEKNFREILKVLGVDLSDPSIQKTPLRVAKMYVDELFCGLNEGAFPKITVVSDSFFKQRREMILIRNIRVHTTCEHHLIPIIGKASIAYFSNGSILGLSKFNRIVDFFCRRPQLQERMTIQIGEYISKILNTQHVAVVIKAQHYCVVARGIQDIESETITHFFSGNFDSDAALRQEFLHIND